jgi:nucleoside-diphosphate-sugar epimerase
MNQTNRPKFTVFGSTGFIGKNIVQYLLDQGCDVYCPGRHELPPKDVHLGHVIYAIGMAGNFRQKPFETIDSEVTALTSRIKDCTFDSWLYLSSTRMYGVSNTLSSEADEIRIYPASDSIFDICKLLCESVCLSIPNKNIRIARLSNVYGIGQNHHTFLGSLLQDVHNHRDIVILEGPDSAKDYISILDVVALLYQISLFGKHRMYNVASGSQITHFDIASKLTSLSNVKVSFSENAQNRRLAPIDTNRIREEFDFKPRSFMSDFENLLRRP